MEQHQRSALARFAVGRLSIIAALEMADGKVRDANVRYMYKPPLMG